MTDVLQQEFGSLLKHAGFVARYLRGGPQAVLWMLELDETDWAIVSTAAEMVSRDEATAMKA